MSARLMKSLAEGKCMVRNNRSGQVRLYWDVGNKRSYVDIDGYATVDLLAHAPIASLRASASLKMLVHAHHLSIIL